MFEFWIMYIQFYKDKRSLNKKYWKIYYIQQLYREGSTTLDKTCWDKSWKSSKFKKWLFFSNSKFSLLPPKYQCWIWPSFVFKSLKLCKQHWFGGRGVFSLKNRFSILSQQFCPRLWLLIFFEKTIPNCPVVLKCMLLYYMV